MVLNHNFICSCNVIFFRERNVIICVSSVYMYLLTMDQTDQSRCIQCLRHIVSECRVKEGQSQKFRFFEKLLINCLKNNCCVKTTLLTWYFYVFRYFVVVFWLLNVLVENGAAGHYIIFCGRKVCSMYMETNIFKSTRTIYQKYIHSIRQNR